MVSMTAMASSRVELEHKTRERKKEKQEAITYLKDKGAQKQLEFVLNEAVRLKPDDLFGYLTREISRLSSPVTVYKVVGDKIVDIGGETAVKVTVHCIVNGVPEAVESAVCCLPAPVNAIQSARSQSSLSRSSKTSVIIEEPSHSNATANALETIEEIVAKSSELLKDKEIANLQALDSCLQSPDISVIGNASATWTESLALAKSACQLLHKPLYKMVAMLAGIDLENEKLSCPIVIGKMLSGGPASTGKLRIRDFSVIPSDKMDYEEGIKSVCKFHQSLGRILAAKYGPSAVAVLCDGSYTPCLDKPEQAFDLLQEALTASELQWKTQLSLVVNIDASCNYDSEKKRYELTTGQWKTRDDLLVYYADLVTQRPEILALESPFADEDSESWQKLSERLGERHLIIGEHDRPEAITGQEREDSAEADTVSLLVDRITWNCQATLSKLCQISREITSGGNELLVTGDSGSNSECIPETAVGILAKYVKLPGPAYNNSLWMYNRLVDIYHDLKANNRLGHLPLTSEQTEAGSD